MSTVEMIVLANSRKHSGRCVAGIRTDGRGWMRPVGMRDDGLLTPKYYTLADGTEAGLIDVIRLKLVGERAEPHHPENWRVRSASWELVARPANASHFDLLSAHVVSGPALLGNTRDRVLYKEFLAQPADASLALIAPQNVQWCIQTKPGGYERKIRVGFTLAGAHYDLAITDPRWEARLLNLPSGTHARNAVGLRDEDALLFTVSLSEPFAPDDTAERACYKLVAAVIVVSQPAPGRYALAVSSAVATSAVPVACPTIAPAKLDLSAIDLSAYDEDPFADPPDDPSENVPVLSAALSKQEIMASTDSVLQNAVRKPEVEASAASEKPLSGFARLRQTVPCAFMRWTPEEDARLTRLHQDGNDFAEIAARMQRHVGAIEKRLEKSGLFAEANTNTEIRSCPSVDQNPPSTGRLAAGPLDPSFMDGASSPPTYASARQPVRNKMKAENDAFEEAEAYARHGERWSDAEDNRLIDMVRSGWSDAEIALELQRRVGAVHARVVKLIFCGVVTLARQSPDGNHNEGNE